MRFIYAYLLLALWSAPAWAEDTPLSLDVAVQQALANNPSLQATMQEVGMSRADLVQAGLVDNPELGASLRFPNQSGFATNSDFSLTFNLLSLSLRPVRQRLAGLALQQAQVRVTAAAIELASNVRASWYRLAAAQQTLVLQEAVVAASEGAAELARQQYRAGNISELDLNRQTAAAAQDQLELGRCRQDVRVEQQRLGLLVASSGPIQAGELPTLPSQDPDEAALEARAVGERGDMISARLGQQVLQETLTLRRREAGWGQVRAGVDGGQEIEGVTVIGPTLQWTLPLFNSNVGEVQKVQVQMQQSHWQLAAREEEVRTEVRTAYEHLQMAREQAEVYDRDVVPARQKIVDQGQLHYNNMLLSVYQLLADRQALSQAQQQRIAARRDYWLATTELDRAVGGMP